MVERAVSLFVDTHSWMGTRWSIRPPGWSRWTLQCPPPGPAMATLVHQQCPAAVSSTRSSRRSPVIALSRQLLPPPPSHPLATCHRHPIVRTYSITCASTAIERLHSTTEYFVYINIDRNVCVYFTILHCTKLHQIPLQSLPGNQTGRLCLRNC